ncbi:MAG: DUF3418 domain-containing protein, partial [Gammaproteobacteria bacterium]
CLPKPIRRNFVPAPNFAQVVLERVTPGEGGLQDAMARELHKVTGVEIRPEHWRLEQVPEHLFMNYRVINERGATLAEGRDLEALRRKVGGEARKSFEAAKAETTRQSGGSGSELERDGLVRWDFGDLPERVEVRRGSVVLNGWPALVESGDTVAIRVFETEAEARAAHPAGLRRMFLCEAGQKARYLKKHIPLSQQACLRYQSVGDCASLKNDIARAVLDSTLETQRPLRTQAEWEERRLAAEKALMERANRICDVLNEALGLYLPVRKIVHGGINPARLTEMADIRSQLDHLVFKGFVSATPWDWLQHYPRYLRAIERRLTRLDQDPAKDRANSREVDLLWKDYLELAKRKSGEVLSEYRWLIEEYRVSLFAQELKTAHKVSAKRLAAMRKEV